MSKRITNIQVTKIIIFAFLHADVDLIKYGSYFVDIKYSKDALFPWFVHSTAFRKCIYDVTYNVLRHRFQKA